MGGTWMPPPNGWATPSSAFRNRANGCTSRTCCDCGPKSWPATHPERMDEVVADLTAAVEIGLTQGSLVLALRAANDLARLPDDVRRPDWREVLLSVVDRYPPGSTSAELAEARAILGS